MTLICTATSVTYETVTPDSSMIFYFIYVFIIQTTSPSQNTRLLVCWGNLENLELRVVRATVHRVDSQNKIVLLMLFRENPVCCMALLNYQCG